MGNEMTAELPKLPECFKHPQVYGIGWILYTADQMNAHYVAGYEAGRASCATQNPTRNSWRGEMSTAFNIPAGWELTRCGEHAIQVDSPDGGRLCFVRNQDKSRIGAFCFDLLDAMLAAAPTPPVDAVPGEPVAKLQAIGWTAFDARENRMRTRCETREQIDAYIHQQHQSRDDITLYARPIFAGERS